MTTTASKCVFCSIVAGDVPATVVREWDDVIAIRPRRGGVSDGHVLVIPRIHVADVGENPAASATAMARAAELAAELDAANVITSKGSAATQTVFHLHIHVVPREDGDGLPLPWTPQQTAPQERVRVVMAREPIPVGPKVFLAGPSARAGGQAPSWRPEAIEALAARWTGPGPLTVLSPESRDGMRAARYEDQVDWETEARASADAILFWIPRDVRALPGFTTNVEFGLDAPTGRAVLGCPPDCPNPERNRYVIYVANRHGVPVAETLADTAEAALTVVRKSSVAVACEVAKLAGLLGVTAEVVHHHVDRPVVRR